MAHEMSFSTQDHVAIVVGDGDVQQKIEDIKKTLAEEIFNRYMNQQQTAKVDRGAVD